MSQDSPFFVSKVAVLGAGTMGAQIAAHMANAGISCYLFDLPNKDGPANALIEKSIKALHKINPAPLSTKKAAELIIPANYDVDLSVLSECDLVIEAIAENIEIKQSLYQTVVPHLNENAIFASNTSGLRDPSELTVEEFAWHRISSCEEMERALLSPDIVCICSCCKTASVCAEAPPG